MATYTIKQGDTLSGIAQQYGTNANDLAKSNNIADPNVIQAGANLTVPDSSVSSPKVPNTFNAADLSTPSNFDVPPATPPASVDPFVASLESSQKSFQDAYDAANKEVKPIQTERDTLTTRLQSALDSLKGKGSSLVSEEAKLGVPENIKQLNELNLQIATKKGEFDKAAMNAENQAIPVGLIQGQQAQIRRQQAVELGALASVAQALQGNIALAQQTAQRTVDLEFSDKEQEVKNLQTLLSVNADNLTTAEKKSAAQLSYILDQRQKEIDQAKEDRKNVLSLASQAAQYGADNTTLSKMSQAKTPEEAIAIGGNFLGAKYKNDIKQQEFDNNLALKNFALDSKLKQAQIDNIKSEIQARNTKNNPTFDVSKFNIPGLPADVKNKMVITEIMKNPSIAAGTKTSVANALGVVNALKSLADAHPDGNFPGVNPINTFLDVKIPFTDLKVVPFRDTLTRKTVTETDGYINALNLKVQQWASGASLTKQQTEQVAQITPGKDETDKTFRTKMNNLTNFMLEQIASSVQSEGVSFTPEKVDLFETGDLLKGASKEQIAELKKQGLIK